MSHSQAALIAARTILVKRVNMIWHATNSDEEAAAIIDGLFSDNAFDADFIEALATEARGER